MRSPFLAVAVVSWLPAVMACEAGDSPGSHATSVARPLPAVPPKPAVVAAPAAPAPPSGAAAIEWKGSVKWHTWAEALPIASRESKPILVLVFADWCPHCRELGPVFADPEVEALAKRFVMVRQNHDDDPPWLQPHNQKFGGYVPRIFFFDASGKIREDITSGHPRYPFFYAAEQPEFLKKAMRRAAGS